MHAFCLLSVGLALVAWSVSGQAQNGCKPSDPTGYFEGTVLSQQAGKRAVTLNLHCDNGRYAGELVTPAGTYTVKDGHVDENRLHLKLESGADTVTVEAKFDAESLGGNFAPGTDTGFLELRRTGDPRSSIAREGLSLSKEQRHQDLSFLASELPKRHANAFHFISREGFEAEVAELDGKLDHLNDDEIYVGMDRVANSIGDGHTYIRV